MVSDFCQNDTEPNFEIDLSKVQHELKLRIERSIQMSNDDGLDIEDSQLE